MVALPWWLSLLLPFFINFIKKNGIPLLEKAFPKIAPLLEEILGVLGGNSAPSPALHQAAEVHSSVTNGVGMPPVTDKPGATFNK